MFLHGGPGAAVIPWLEIFHTLLLDEHFMVVHWDQRGAGSSYSPELTADDITPGKFVADTLELTDILRERFGQECIFLSGHSWGSALGFLILSEDTSPYFACIAISERVDCGRSYYKALQAPDKSFTVNENAAHMIMFEQPEAWAKALVAIKSRVMGK